VTFVLTSDPVLSVSDARALLGIQTDQEAILIVNALSAKLKRYTGRVQINQNTTTAIVEKIIPYAGDKLYLHAPIWTGTAFTISAALYSGGDLTDTYTLADGELQYQTSDNSSHILLVAGRWPDDTLNGYVQVTYKGGWATVPFDVIQGALMQARVDIRRMQGEVGVTSRGALGESTQFQTVGIVRECMDLWEPYRILL
jgi:hypothetical protein